ncbi:MAG: protein arginine kinase [Gemmatimonadaceae bacterium]|nr:protein arginine kinase [Gemmatimonadaceae bacterium]
MSLDLTLLPDGGVPWLAASGEHADIVLSSRIRLARNIAGFNFSARERDGERLRVLACVRDAIPRVPTLGDAVVLRLDELSAVDRQVLRERHLVSRELAGEGSSEVRPASAVLVAEAAGVMVNEEDHLRIQVFRSGFDIPRALSQAVRVDRELGAHVPYAFHREFGFLTSCPTNTGTGMRASVLVHLPGLVLTQEVGKVLQGLQQMGLTHRGLYGEGSDVVGSLFQVSNQTTLGRSEEELAEHLQHVVKRLVEQESAARRVLVRDAGYIIEDKLWRAYGTLRYARSLGSDEAMNLLSAVRLAVGLQLVGGLGIYTLNKLLIHGQTAHLSHQAGRALTESEANIARARYVRAALANEGSADG